MSRRYSTRSLLAGASAVAFLSGAAPGDRALAASLFFFKGPTKAPNERVCLGFARDQAQRHGLQNIRRDNLGVSGTRNGLFAVMTCVGSFVVVMVSGDGGANGAPLAKELFDAVRSETCIDSC